MSTYSNSGNRQLAPAPVSIRPLSAECADDTFVVTGSTGWGDRFPTPGRSPINSWLAHVSLYGVAMVAKRDAAAVGGTGVPGQPSEPAATKKPTTAFSHHPASG